MFIIPCREIRDGFSANYVAKYKKASTIVITYQIVLYICNWNRHVTLFEQMDTTKAHKTSCQTWRLVFIEISGEWHLHEVKRPGIIQ